MLNCRETTQLLSESQERRLSLREKTALRLHLMICSGCRRCQQQMDILRMASKAYTKGAGESKDE